MNFNGGQVVEFIYNGETFIGIITGKGIQAENFFVDYCAVKPLRIWGKKSSFYYLNKIKHEVEPLCQYPNFEKVEVDTPITFIGTDGNKVRAHFAKWEDGYIYLWENGKTSHTTDKTWYTKEKYWKEIIINSKGKEKGE